MSKERFVVAVLEEHESETIQKAVEALVDKGIDKGSIAVIARVEDEEKLEDVEIKKAEKHVLSWSKWGALSGGLLGLLVGGVVFTAPVTGPVAAVGASLAGAINGLLGGAVAGGALFGAGDGLVEWGMASEDAKRLEKELENGKVLLIVKSDASKLDEIESTLKESGAQRVEVL